MKYIVFTVGLILTLSACGNEASESQVPETVSQTEGGETAAVTENTPGSTPVAEEPEAASMPKSSVEGGETSEAAKSQTGENLIEKISAAREEKQQQENARSAILSLEKIREENDTVVVDIRLKNPEARPLAAVRSFIAYDPKALEGMEVKLSETGAFTIPAPGEFDFDEESGIIKVGLSVPEGGTTDAKDQSVARLIFQRRSTEFTTLDFFDFESDEGHTVVLEKIGQDRFRNVLRAPEVPTLLFLPRS